MVRGKSFSFIFDRLWQVLAEFRIEPVEIVGSIHTINTACAGASAVETKGGHACNNIRITNKIRSTGVTEAGTAGVCIIGQ